MGPSSRTSTCVIRFTHRRHPPSAIYTQQRRWQLATSLQHPEETNSDWLTSRKSRRSLLALVFFPTMLVYHRTFERTQRDDMRVEKVAPQSVWAVIGSVEKIASTNRNDQKGFPGFSLVHGRPNEYHKHEGRSQKSTMET